MYRTPAPCFVLEYEPDPFPTFPCVACGAPTVSMGNESRCAPCDYYWLTGDMLALDWRRFIVAFGCYPRMPACPQDERT